MAAASSPFAAVTATGALIAPAQIARIAAAALPGQDAAAYGVPKGLALRDELARFFRIGQAHWREFATTQTPGPGATTRFVESLLKEVLGFSDIVRRTEVTELGGRSFPIALTAGAVPVVVVPGVDPIDRASDTLGGAGRRRSAAVVAQEYLNADPDALWGLATNGRCLRLVRDNPSLTRPAFIEFDLAAIFDDEAYADFTALFLTLHRTRFAANDAECALERYRIDGAKAGSVAREKLRGGVEAALELLGQGFLEHPANAALADRLRSGVLPLADYYAALLRLVYRLIFLLSAEDRNLLHPAEAPPAPRQLYARGYALGRLRDRAVRRAAWDRHHDSWDGLCVVMGALGRGEPRLGLPALGGLFASGSLPDLEGAWIANARLLEAIYRLAWLREPSGPVPVNWRDMESEELGSVYEGLLELVPRLELGGARFAFVRETAETKGNARKVSGSYYTPDSLVQALLDSALTPVLDAAAAGTEDPAAALLALCVVDPACGSGHFLLAAARRIAAKLADVRTAGAASQDDYRHALREVMSACIYGVDRNPMAVELTKVALWIESVEPGKPLGLLDANIRCGDALLGLDDLGVLEKGIPDSAYSRLTGDDKAVAGALKKINKAERDRPILTWTARKGALAQEAARVAAMPEETLAQVEAKQRAQEVLAGSPARAGLRLAADAWVAAFLAPKPAGVDFAAVPTTRHVWEAARGALLPPAVTLEVERLTRFARVFHWPLEFPAVLAGDKAGFDLVIGNPPWERIKLQEKEFFAARDPDIATAPNTAARGRMIAALATAEEPFKRALHAEFEAAKRTAEASSAFAHVGEDGRFPLTGRGDVNTYALFAESFARLSGTRGRAGFIVPTGIATDATTAPFFAHLIQERHLVSLFAFENEEFIFPGVHHSTKFALLCLSGGVGTSLPEFAFSLRQPAALLDVERRFTLSPDQIAAINPNTKTAPVFRARADAELTAQIYARVPVLIEEAKGAAGNPWGITFQAMFHMSNDSGLFRTAAQLAGDGFDRDGTDWTRGAARYVPLYEAKMIHQFDHRWATYAPGEGAGDGEGSRDADLAEKQDPAFQPTPRYWVAAAEVEGRLAAKAWTRGWLMGWRDIARATDERTVIGAAFPLGGANNKLPLFFVKKEPQLAVALLCNLSSLILDYIARQKVGSTSITYFYMKQFAVLPPSAYRPADFDFIVSHAVELTYTSNAIAPFARDLGFDGPPFGWDEARRAQLRAELDAWYARAYGLTRDQLRYILDPAELMGSDYPSETFRVLKDREKRLYGEYLTRRLTLAAWDAQESVPAAPRAIPMPISIDPASLPDGVWTRPIAGDVHANTLAQMAALLKALPGPVPSRQARLAALYALEPRLLTARLLGEDRRHWTRLVGTEAALTTGAVTTLGLGGATGWGEAVRQLLADGSLVFDAGADTWSPGLGLELRFTTGWPERAAFAFKFAGAILAEDSVMFTVEETKGLEALAA
jgi:hypothetical protein